MQTPTQAPWAGQVALEGEDGDAVAAPPRVAPGRTGARVKPLIDAEPELPTVDPASWPTDWQPAAKRLTCDQHVQQALKGGTLRKFVAFTLSLNEAVVGVKLSDECHVSPCTKRLLDALDRLSQLCKETPRTEHARRYGNPAYKAWFQKMQDTAPSLVYDILGDDLGPATIELLPYFLDSFGNSSRIDYGTGHETTFVCLLYCLYALGLLTSADRQATVTRVFKQYLALMRELQTTYWLEPAGSHGVWGLDEYHFYPFIWGAAQLRDHAHARPKSITNDETLEALAEEYMYMDAVQFIRTVKKGPLHETSPLLYDISGVPTWQKVNTGLFKMYQVEVLSKLPIMQHFLWGSLMPYPG